MTEDALPLASISPPALLLLALLLHVLLCSSGRVARLFAAPMRFAGSLIETFEKRYNRPAYNDRLRRRESVSVAAMLLLVGALAGAAATLVLDLLPWGWGIEALAVAMLVDIRPAAGRLRILARALEGDIEAASATLGLLTGRDAEGLDAGGIAAAGIESAIQALARGLVAPVLWYMTGGLAALFAFRMVNTASMMIDEHSDHARSFGSAPRYLSAVFLVPAIVLMIPLLFVSSLLVPGVRSLAMLHPRSFAGRHAWPVFALPVAAFATALDVRLGGPVRIGSFHREGTVFRPEARQAAPADLLRARQLMVACGVTTAALLALLALALPDPVAWPLPLFT